VFKKMAKKIREHTIMSEQKTEIASDTYKTANAKLALEKSQLENTNTALATENEALRQQLGQANSIIENDLKADLIVRIQSASEYKEDELLSMTRTQLQTIEQTLSKGKTFDVPAMGKYKSIRAGSASADSKLTVGSLYGKTRSEILKMGGDF
jgi:hypothetical protein